MTVNSSHTNTHKKEDAMLTSVIQKAVRRSVGDNELVPDQKTMDEQCQDKENPPKCGGKATREKTSFLDEKPHRRMNCIGDFELGPLLGKGYFGKVYSARLKPSCTLAGQETKVLALKIMSKKRIEEEEMYEHVKREVEVQSRVGSGHPNICRLFSYFHDVRQVYLCLEYAPYGSLLNHALSQHQQGEEPPMVRLPESVVRILIGQLTDALAYLHSLQVIHRDIKPENVYVKEPNRSFLLGDFGNCALNQTNHQTAKYVTICGALEYLPPEMVESVEYDETVDEWMLGVLMYEVLMGKTPFAASSVQDTYDRIVQCERIEFHGEASALASEPAQQVMRSWIVKDPSNRVSVRNITRLDWFTGDDFVVDEDDVDQVAENVD